MDSMRSLNTSLPSARPAPPEALLQAFRTAALSVTTLYKSAVTDQNASRQAGYQEALADLLAFLDKENLGLQDGEGWRVRQWATERYDGSAFPQQTESDDDRSESGQRPRSITPSREQQQAPAPTGQLEPPRIESVSQHDDPSSSAPQHRPATTPMFYFSGNPASTSHDVMQTDNEVGHTTAEQPVSASTSNVNRTATTNPRGSRTPHRSGSQRPATRSSTREFTFTTGSKRKFQIPDFFDIGNIGTRDGVGGNKRGRLS